jgi:hypothetical protein
MPMPMNSSRLRDRHTHTHGVNSKAFSLSLVTRLLYLRGIKKKIVFVSSLLVWRRCHLFLFVFNLCYRTQRLRLHIESAALRVSCFGWFRKWSVRVRRRQWIHCEVSCRGAVESSSCVFQFLLLSVLDTTAHWAKIHFFTFFFLFAVVRACVLDLCHNSSLLLQRFQFKQVHTVRETRHIPPIYLSISTECSLVCRPWPDLLNNLFPVSPGALILREVTDLRRILAFYFTIPLLTQNGAERVESVIV